MRKILDMAIDNNASDVLISVNHPPVIRITGQLFSLPNEKVIGPNDAQELSFSLMTEPRRRKFLEEKEIDFSYDFEGRARFRVNVFFQRGQISINLRLIPSNIRTIEELSLPAILHALANKSQGLVLITGASGQGKSTTLAALIDEINHTRHVHVVTIEDPIEYVFSYEKAIIDQREVLEDTHSFNNALKSVLRQNPDIIMVGEMRDLETIAAALTAAETGHLVLATLHTNSAAQSIDRIIDVFPSKKQNQIRFQLASSLLAVVSQRLIPRLHGGFIPACEVMICNNAVANLIRENKNHEIPAVIETSSHEGMISLNWSLAELVKRKEISLQEAINHALNPLELKNLLQLK